MTLDEKKQVCAEVLEARQTRKVGHKSWNTSQESGHGRWPKPRHRTQTRYFQIRDLWIQVRVRDQAEDHGEHTLSIAVVRDPKAKNPIRLLALRYHELTESWDVTALAEAWLRDNTEHCATACVRELGDQFDIWDRLRRAPDVQSVVRAGTNRLVADLLNPPEK